MERRIPGLRDVGTSQYGSGFVRKTALLGALLATSVAAILSMGCGNGTPSAVPKSSSSAVATPWPSPSGSVSPDDLLLHTPGFFPEEDPNLYGKFVEVIKTQMPGTTQGAAVALRFINASSGYRYTAGFTSDPGFIEFKKFPGKTIMFGKTDSGEGLVLIFSEMKPGHYDCAKDDFDIEFAPAGVKGTDPSANWAQNDGGSCEIEMYEGNHSGDLQGTISGKVVSNDRATLFTIEQGYFYARKPFLPERDESAPRGKHDKSVQP